VQAIIRKLLDTSSPTGKVLRGAAVAFVARGLGIVVAYLFQVLLARWSGPYEYGLFALAWTWMLVNCQIAPVGFNEVVLRFIPADSAHGLWGRVKALTVISPLITAAFATAFGALGAAVLWWLPALQGWEYREVMLWAFACTPFLAVLVLNEGLGRALGSVLVAFLPRNLALPLLILVAAGVIHFRGDELTARDVLVISLVAAAVTMLVHCMLIARQVPAEARAAPAEYRTREWLRVSLPIGVASAAIVLEVLADPIIVGFFASPEDLAVYQAASRTAQLLVGAQIALNVLTAPMIARINALRDFSEMRNVVANYIRWSFWPCAAGCLVFAVFGRLILAQFGAGFSAGYELLLILSFGYLLNCCFGPLKDLMTMTGHHDRCALMFVIGTGITLLLIFAGAALFGMVGAATAKVVGVTGLRVWLTYAIYRRSGMMPVLFAARLGRDRLGNA